jgi:3-methyladenine DNA glycosylase AlkC
MVSKVSDVQQIVKSGIAEPRRSFPAIKTLAASQDWQEREVAATALVEISKKKPDEVVAEMLIWSDDLDPNIRRTASEGLRDIARKSPSQVLPVLEKLNADPSLYVRKSVANVLRNVSRRNPDFALQVCRRWAAQGNSNTNWIIKDGLKKLKETQPKEVEGIIDSLGTKTS